MDDSENMWPVWLTAGAFTDWYHGENRLRELTGDDPLPNVPPDVLVELADAEEREQRADTRVRTDPVLMGRIAVAAAGRSSDLGESFRVNLDIAHRCMVSTLVEMEMEDHE